MVYVVMVAIIWSSLIINRQYESSPDNILMNFGMASMGLVLGLSFFDALGKKTKTVLIIIGTIYFIYISLYYLIGFHNPHWGN